MKITLNFVGMDSWDRPVYEEENGRLWKDVDPRRQSEPNLCTSVGNVLDGEPDSPMHCFSKYADAEVVFRPERITWN